MNRKALRRIGPDLFLFALCTSVILASVLMTTDNESVFVWGWELPPLCTWKWLTGMECFGCGLTRSFVFMGHGQLTEAFARHWAGPVFWVLVLSQVPWRLFQIIRNLGNPDHGG